MSPPGVGTSAARRSRVTGAKPSEEPQSSRSAIPSGRLSRPKIECLSMSSASSKAPDALRMPVRGDAEAIAKGALPRATASVRSRSRCRLPPNEWPCEPPRPWRVINTGNRA